MEEKLITAVSLHPIIYDSAASRGREDEEEAWSQVAAQVGLSVDVCRSRWRELLDVYMREKKDGGRSGSPEGPVEKWRFSAVLAFLDPFISPRETSGGMGQGVEEDGIAKTDHAESSAGPPPPSAGPTAAVIHAQTSDEDEDTDVGSAAAASAWKSVGARPSVIQRRREKMAEERGRRRERWRWIEKLLVLILKRPPAPPAPSEDELFLHSMVPSLQRLSTRQKEYVKYQIHKIIYEVSSSNQNVDHVEP